jgi:hypothetical protein
MIGLGVALLAAALTILGRDGRALRRVELKRDEELGKDINDRLGKAKALNKKAEKHMADAKVAFDATQKRLEKISEKDTDMDDLLSSWQSERMRQQSG